MTDYISREALRRMMYEESFEKDSQYQRWDSGCWIRYKLFEHCVEAIPAADVVEVRHGRWVADGDGYHWTYNCSICGWKDGYPFNERHNFCPNCGAKMDGGREE